MGTPEPLDYNQVGDIVSEETGAKVRLEPKSLDEAMQMFSSLVTGGKPDSAPWIMEQGAGRMFMYYNDKGLIGNPNVLEMLLGRKPLDYRSWVKLTVKEIRGQ